jgi:hypothetical protein
MATLHIEHPISDLPTWLGAFSRFREARQRAGVRAERVRQPVDDDKYIYVSLDFDSVEGGGIPELPRDERMDVPAGFAGARRHAKSARSDGRGYRVGVIAQVSPLCWLTAVRKRPGPRLLKQPRGGTAFA